MAKTIVLKQTHTSLAQTDVEALLWMRLGVAKRFGYVQGGWWSCCWSLKGQVSGCMGWSRALAQTVVELKSYLVPGDWGEDEIGHITPSICCHSSSYICWKWPALVLSEITTSEHPGRTSWVCWSHCWRWMWTDLTVTHHCSCGTQHPYRAHNHLREVSWRDKGPQCTGWAVDLLRQPHPLPHSCPSCWAGLCSDSCTISNSLVRSHQSLWVLLNQKGRGLLFWSQAGLFLWPSGKASFFFFYW